jgi:universal stress protein A
MAKISRILYPTDFSEHSLVALPLAVDLANRYSAELHCIYVLDTDNEFLLDGDYVIPSMAPFPMDREAMRKTAEERLSSFGAQQMPEIAGSVQTAVVTGKPFAEIIRYVRDRAIDLIVLGTHGHSALASMLLGSVAEKVVRKAPCAVLTVRHPDHRFQAP